MFRAGNTPFSPFFRPKGPRGLACILAASGCAAPHFGLTAPNPSIVDGNSHHSEDAVNIEINDGGVSSGPATRRLSVSGLLTRPAKLELGVK